MNDLQLFGRTKDQIDSLVKTVNLFSGDMGMTLGVNKCSVIVRKRGKLAEFDGIQLPNGEVIKQVESNINILECSSWMVLWRVI